jgi:GT2 family glycosyltransferase
MTPPQRRISAIVVTYHTGPLLWDSLDALQHAPGVTDIVVVNNGNPPEVEQRLAAEPCWRLLTGHGNIGFAAACNRGAAAASGEALLFVNPDCIVDPETPALLAAAAEAARVRPAVVGGRVLNLDGREQRGCRRDTVTPLRALMSMVGLTRLEPLIPALRNLHRERDPLPDAPSPVGAVSGALFLLMRDDFQRLEGLDEGYFLHVEDLDLCRRAWLEGGATLFHPTATARHARSTSAASPLVVERHKAAGFRRYFRKFAQTPVDKALAGVAGPLIETALLTRARLRGLT